jgi:hypothetical protein
MTTTTAQIEAVKRYRLNRNSFGDHYDVETMAGETVYCAEQWKFRSHTPDLTLHRGANKNGPTIAVSHMPYMSNSFKIGFGEPSQPSLMQWEEMEKNGFSNKGHKWAIDVSSGEDQARRLNLNWKTTKSVGVDGMKVPWSSSRNYKLIAEETQEILAIFTSDRSYKKCGVLQINVDHGEPFEIMVIMTCITVYEQARRDSSEMRGGGGG